MGQVLSLPQLSGAMTDLEEAINIGELDTAVKKLGTVTSIEDGSTGTHELIGYNNSTTFPPHA